jgi:glycosyltransferase involved in cell wall biosynthesis
LVNKFFGKLALQQRVLPSYRVPFFDLLATHCENGMTLFAGEARSEEMITGGTTQIAKHVDAKNIHLLNGKFYLCYQRDFVNWLHASNPDALIVEANPRYLSTPAAVKWMHERGRKVIGWGLGSPSPFRRGVGVRSRFVNQFDAMIAYSQRGADEYASLGFPRQKIFVAHNSVSPAPNFILPDRPLTFNLRPSILFVGRLQNRKRIDSLIRACVEMESKPNLIIVGNGPEKENLQTLAKEIYPQTEFVGAKHGIELKLYFEQADLFVLPGTGGLAVQEAMSYGLPVIVAKGDGTQDDLVREKNGWQIEPENYCALVSTMNMALSNVKRLREMGNESFRIVLEEINIQKMAEKFIQALNS